MGEQQRILCATGFKRSALEALKGPPFEALGIKAANACSDAERQGVKVEFVGLD